MDVYLQRALELAARGGIAVMPNPQVGAVVMHQGSVLGEGWHQQHGGPHAEVQAIAAVKQRYLLPYSTLYVSLEPCNHHGKTPPCTELILQEKIPRVVVGVQDPNPHVKGAGIARLQAQGVQVSVAEDPAPFLNQNRIFFLNQQLRRAYVVLKWAETAQRMMGSSTTALKISGLAAQRYVHYLRASHAAILVGSNTARIDNPQLTLRYHPGRQPQRIILAGKTPLPAHLKLLTDGKPTWVLGPHKAGLAANVRYLQTTASELTNPHSLAELLYQQHGIASLLVEGGQQVLQSFLDAGLFDEIHILRSSLAPHADVPAPRLPASIALPYWQNLGQDLLLTTFAPPRPGHLAL